VPVQVLAFRAGEAVGDLDVHNQQLSTAGLG
jgi:hypothetical protein